MLALAGSLRQGSYNRGLLRAAQEVAPEWVEVQFFDIGTLPFFNEDLKASGDPEPVRRFKEAIIASNAVLIATPSITVQCQGYCPMPLTGPHGQRAAASCATSRWR
jgi:NAD(P)H-dependent FMN reductase